MKENFSKRVQRIIKQSKEEAIRLGHSYVGSEHLLLGLLKGKNGLSKKVQDVYDVGLGPEYLAFNDNGNLYISRKTYSEDWYTTYYGTSKIITP